MLDTGKNRAMTTIVARPPTTLADLLPQHRLRDAALVVGFALFTAAAAQFEIVLGFTPVPISGQTLAVLLAGGALGASRGAASQFLYVALGAIGLPFYSGGEGGWSVTTGATAGYFVGFIVAAGLVGWMSEQGQDRRVVTAIPAFLAGSIVIYAFGASWLAHSLDVPFAAAAGETSALSLGVTPFLVGDVFKAVIAGLLLPGAWAIADRVKGDVDDDGA